MLLFSLSSPCFSIFHFQFIIYAVQSYIFILLSHYILLFFHRLFTLISYHLHCLPYPALPHIIISVPDLPCPAVPWPDLT